MGASRRLLTFRCCGRAASRLREPEFSAAARRRAQRYALTVATDIFMKKVIRLAIIAPILFLAACGTPYWHTSMFDPFPINRGKAAKRQDLIKVIALVPGGGVVADAIGVELAKRGFVVIPSATTIGMVTDVDFKAVHESYIPARQNPGEIGKLIDLSIFHDKTSLIPGPSPGGRREISSLSLRERDRG